MGPTACERTMRPYRAGIVRRRFPEPAPVWFGQIRMTAAKTLNLDVLNNIRIASPCTASWADMEGDERRRMCGQCNLHVHNISEMTAADAAELLLGSTGGRVCVRLYRRADGTVLTADCPVGWRAVKIRAARMAGRAVSAAALLLGLGALQALAGQWGGTTRLVALRPYRFFEQLIHGPRSGPVPIAGSVVMGDFCAPTPATPAPATTPITMPAKGAGS